jgi:hypothetical protein
MKLDLIQGLEILRWKGRRRGEMTVGEERRSPGEKVVEGERDSRSPQGRRH